MPTKIPVNGFGRIGKMLAMAQTWPYLMESQRRMMTQSMKEQELRDIEEINRLHGLDREAQKNLRSHSQTRQLLHNSSVRV